MKKFKLLSLSLILAYLLATLLFSTLGSASTGWSQIYQSGPYDSLIPYSVIQTSDGGYAAAVFAYTKWMNYSGLSPRLEGQYELWLIKFDSTGNRQWIKKFTEIPDPSWPYYRLLGDGPYTLVQTQDGGYAISGTAAGSVFLLMKLDMSGNLQWGKTYLPSPVADSGYSFDHEYSMILTRDGGFALAGSTEAFSSVTNGGMDFWLLKLDSDGNEHWNQTYNCGTYTNPSGDVYPRNDEARSVIQTSDGGYAIAGQTASGSGLTTTYEMWLVKTDTSGGEQWNKLYEGSNMPGAEYRVIQTSDGGYALAGTEPKTSDESDVILFGDPARNSDFYLIKTDSSGAVQWRNSYGDKYADFACSEVQLNDGGFAIAGSITENNKGPVSRDLGLVRVDSSGNQLWSKLFNAKENATMNTKSNEWAYSMCRTYDGGYAIAGNTVAGWDGSHVDVFLIKTETLEQPLATPSSTPIPSPSSSNPASTSVPSPLVVTSVSGTLEMLTPQQNNDAWTQVTNGAKLTEGTKIQTSKNSATLKFSQTTTLEMQPKTLIDIQNLEEKYTNFLLQSGEFTGEVATLPAGSSIDVEMSQAIATIKGTIFTVTENGTESRLSVQEGLVSFKSKADGRTVNVSAGQNATATPAGLTQTPSNQQTGQIPTSTLITAVIVVVVVAVISSVTYIAIKRRHSKENN